jgi:phosphoribosylanthranilate isomerase
MMIGDDRTRIKICGITNLDDARCAVEAEVDFLGFIFYPRSPRYIAPEEATALVQVIRAEHGASAPLFVGVFVNEAVGHVQAVLDVAGLDLAQLHGAESPKTVERLAPRAFKAIRPQRGEDVDEALAAYGHVLPANDQLPQLLLDAYHPERFGGTGLQADVELARPAARRCRLLLAGGLGPETVGQVIEEVRPWGVDVSSGVERDKGIKDHTRIRAFVQAVKGVS